MANKKNGILVLTGLWVLAVFGQTFTGTVVDVNSGKPLALANIYLVELGTGTITDHNGVFTIMHYPKKKIHLQISIIGYKTVYEVLDFANESQRQFYLEPGHVDLKEIVVSVPGGKLQKENVVNLEAQKLRLLEQSAPVSLAEAISNIAGIDQNSTGAGIGKPVIRGLSGNRIVTFAQGIRIENQQWGEEHGLGVGSVGIESIEVIKGPASLLYGSDALGGVLFFVDERYAKHNFMEGFAQTRFLSNTLGSYNQAGVKLHKQRFKLNLFGAYTTNTDYEVPNLDRVFNSRFDEKNLKTSIGYQHKNWITNVRYSYLQNNFGISEDAAYTSTTSRSRELPFQTINNHNLSFENTLFTGNSRVNLIMGYTDNRREEFEESANEAALEMSLKTYSYNLKWYAPTVKEKINLIIGSQGMYQTNSNRGEEILIPDAATSDLGGFVIASYNTDKLQLQGGIRGDYRFIDAEETTSDETRIEALEKHYSNLNFSGGAAWNHKKITLRTNVATGFRAPNTSELLSNGVHEGTNRYEIGNPGLKSENATQMDFTFDYLDDHFSFSVNGFYNSIKNYIYLAPTTNIIDNNPVFEYLQTNATLLGTEIGFHYHPHGIHWLHLESNFSAVFAEDGDDNPLPLIPAPKLNSVVKAEFSGEGAFKLHEVFVRHIYRFKQDRPGIFETETSDYHLFNAGLNFEIKTNNFPINITTGVKNIFNKKYVDHLSRFKTLGIPNQGLDVYLGLNIAFEKKI